MKRKTQIEETVVRMDGGNLAEIHAEMEKKWAAKDYRGVSQLLRVLHRVKTTKDDIVKSKIARRIKRLFDEVS